MKIGVISDTHLATQEIQLPSAILQAFKDMDMIIHSGDLVDFSVIEKLKTVCGDIRAVYGNMDPEGVRKKLPEKLIIEVGKFRIGVMHGWGHPDKLTALLTEKFENDNVNVIIFGHSHLAMNEKKRNTLFFNPGSATDKIFATYNSYGIIEINDTIKARIVKI